MKEKEKEEKKAEKAAAKAAAAAAAALASASAASTAASSVGAVAGDIVDGASTVIEQSAEESTGESEVGTEETAETATADVDMPVAPSSKKDIPIVPAAAVVGVAAVGGGGFAFKYMKNKAASDEEERQRQFDLIMGNVDESTDSSAPSFADLDDDPATVPDVDEPSAPAKDVETTSTPAAAPPKKKKKGMGSIFSKKASSGRETNINNLFAEDALAPDFTLVLAQYLTFGAPGRFPKVVNLPSPKGYTIPETFESENAKKDITKVREDAGLTDVMAAELFATVVNCMIIDIIDLASSTLTMKGDEKEKDKKTVDALNVVMDFMDHAAGLFDAVADGVAITPVTYEGKLSKAKLEKLFGIYAGSLMSSLMSEDAATTQDRVDTLQQVFSIKDKKAEGIAQKIMMKNLMSSMKDGEGGGMEGLAEMMKGFEGMEGMEGGFPGMGDPNAELSPEDIKQSVSMMKELVESGQITKEEVALVKQQFKEAYGSDIEDLIKEADSGDMEGDLGDEGKELLDLFKKVLDEDK